MSKKLPKFVWANAINLSGLYRKQPMKCILNSYRDEWYDKSGDFSVRKLGLDDRGGFISFASENKKEVEFWVQGVRATMHMMKLWCYNA